MEIQKPTSVVTVFLTRGSEVLLLKRSATVGTYQGLWAGVSGYLEADDPVEQAWIELEEEMGLRSADTQLSVRGLPIDIADRRSQRSWRVYPFRFALLLAKEPRLNWENTEMRWVLPNEIKELPTVPGLFDAWLQVADGF